MAARPAAVTAPADAFDRLIRGSQNLGPVSRSLPVSLLLMLRDPSAARQAARVAASFDRQSTHFRLALLIVAALLVVLGALRLTGPAIAVAAAGVPLLYLLYRFDVDVYEEEPVRVVGLTFVLGLLLGIPWALWTGPAVTRAVLHGASSGSLTDGVLIAGILVPLGAQVLMLAGPLALYFTGRQREPLDGFSFSVA
jgi:hypothetical protein